MATEPIQSGPYPVPADPPDGPNQMSAIVTWAAGRTVMRFATVAARAAAIPSPVDGMISTTGTGATLQYWGVKSGAWVLLDAAIAPAVVAYTPALVNITLGTGGTAVGRYSVSGKQVTASVVVTLGTSGFSVGAGVYIAPPLPPHASYPTYGLIGTAGLVDVSAGAIRLGFATRSGIQAEIKLADGSQLLPTVPWTWAAGDRITVTYIYEAA